MVSHSQNLATQVAHQLVIHDQLDIIRTLMHTLYVIALCLISNLCRKGLGCMKLQESNFTLAQALIFRPSSYEIGFSVLSNS